MIKGNRTINLYYDIALSRFSYRHFLSFHFLRILQSNAIDFDKYIIRKLIIIFCMFWSIWISLQDEFQLNVKLFINLWLKNIFVMIKQVFKTLLRTKKKGTWVHFVSLLIYFLFLEFKCSYLLLQILIHLFRIL